MSFSTAHFRIAATTDVHMYLTGTDMLRGVDDPTRGMDRLATLIRAERAGAQGGFLLVDNGDALQGAPMGDVCMTAPDTNPWPEVLNDLGYDAVGLGNHDFDFGLSVLATVMGRIDAPVLCANVAPGSVPCTTPTALIDRDVRCSDGQLRTVRIGLTSVLPPQTAAWSQRCLNGAVAFEGGLQATKRTVADLRRTGADLVLVLCHSGLSDGLDATGENFGAAIAQEVDGIDAMILGHTHLRFPGQDHAGFEGVDVDAGTVHGVPAVMPGHAGQDIGVIDLNLRHGASGWSVNMANVRREGVNDTVLPNPAILRMTEAAAHATRAHLETPLGSVRDHLRTWFSMLRPSRAEALVARALSNTIAKAVAGTELARLPLLASVAPPAMGGRAGVHNYVDITPGPLVERHVAMLCPFPNTVWAAVLTGAEVWDWIDRSLVFFNGSSKQDSPLVRSDIPSFNFDAVHGIEAEIDPFAKSPFDVNGHRVRRDTSRVRRLTHDGRDIRAQDRFVLAMTSFRGAGGGNFPGLGAETPTLRTDVELREAVRREVARDFRPPNALPWRFANQGRHRRVIHTSPAAEPYLGDIAGFEPEPLGLDQSGFLKVAVTV